LFTDWKKVFDEQPKFFSVLDENGNISNYYQNNNYIDVRRQRIGEKPENLRTPEERAYYE
jgi:hypothetical protein